MLSLFFFVIPSLSLHLCLFVLVTLCHPSLPPKPSLHISSFPLPLFHLSFSLTIPSLLPKYQWKAFPHPVFFYLHLQFHSRCFTRRSCLNNPERAQSGGGGGSALTAATARSLAHAHAFPPSRIMTETMLLLVQTYTGCQRDELACRREWSRERRRGMGGLGGMNRRCPISSQRQVSVKSVVLSDGHLTSELN